jgi:hypothetical protein
LKAKQYLIRGKNRILVPLQFLDKVMGTIAETTSGTELDNLKLVAVNLIRRTAWKEMLPVNANKKYEEIKVPITLKEYNWLKTKYDTPI